MRQIKVYLAGPMMDCNKEEMLDWRKKVKMDLKPYGVKFLDPTRRSKRKNLSSSYIVDCDKKDILNSDIVFVNLWKHSIGTSMEVLFAWENNKGIICCAQKDIMNNIWLKHHTGFVEDNLYDAIRRLKIATMSFGRG